MNIFPSDADSNSSPADPLAEALRRLQPARCEIDTAQLFYRSGYAAALAERRGRAAPTWARAASLMLVAALSAAGGYSLGGSAAAPALVRSTEQLPESPNTARPAHPTQPLSPPVESAPDPVPAAQVLAAGAGTATAGAAPVAIDAAAPPGDVNPPSHWLAASLADVPVWGYWLGWQGDGGIEPSAPAGRLTVRPSAEQWQQLVGLHASADKNAAWQDAAVASAADSHPSPMLSSAATDIILRDLIQ